MKKKEKIQEQLKEHFEKKLYTRITRGYKKDFEEISRGYILKYSKDFVLIKEEDEFKFIGFHIIPIKTIKEIRDNVHDQYCDYINKSEHNENEFIIQSDEDINLTSWDSIFNDLKNKNEPIITECEKFKHKYFCIGHIKEVENKSVHIEYFDAEGYIDEELVKHKYKWITKVTFKDNYSKVFSKYTRNRN
jgi:hypothetical protein